MSIMAAAIQGLPPLPKSLSGLLNFNRESFSRENALRNPAQNPGNPQPPQAQNGQPANLASSAACAPPPPPGAHAAAPPLQQFGGVANPGAAGVTAVAAAQGAGNSGTMSSGYHSATSIQASPSPSPFR